MIRINLLSGQTSVPKTSGGNTQGFTTATSASSISMASSGGGAEIAVKLLIALGPLIGFVGTEQWMMGNKVQELERIRSELNIKNAEIEAKKQDVEQVRRFKADKAQLDQRMDTIRKLSQARLRNVKALDAIQNVIPTKAWLTNLKFEELKVDIRGQAMEDGEISAFMKGLEENIYFSQVLLTKSSSVKAANGVVKEFNIIATLENL